MLKVWSIPGVFWRSMLVMLHLPITHVKINMIVFSNSRGFQNDIYVGQLLSFTQTIAQ